MNNVEINQIDSQSFTDAKIISMTLNEKHKSLDIDLEGGWIIKDNQTVFLSNSKFSIVDWLQLDIFLEDEASSQYIQNNPNVSQIVGSICEVEISDNEVVIRGYGKGATGVWTEWKFLNSKITLIASEANA